MSALAQAAGTDGRLAPRLFALGVVPSWVALVLTGGVVLVFGPPPPTVQIAAVAAGAVALGLPHGAVDHLALPRARGTPADRRALAAVGLLYLGVGGAYAAAWFLAPVAAALSFLALTWLHWGQGDVYPLVALAPGGHPADRRGRALLAAVRGGLPMGVPLVAFPGWYRRVLGWFAAPFGGSAAGLDWLVAPRSRLLVAGALAALTVAALVRGYRRGGPTPAWRVDVAETLLLWAFFLVVPPLLAVGLYFCLWHSLRHVARLVAVDDAAAGALAAGRPVAALGRFVRDAAPLTAGALALLGCLWLVVPVPPGGPGEVLGLSFAFVAVLTAPHVVVVALLDRVQGVWAG